LWQEWDIVADMRNSLLSRLYRAKKRYIWSRQRQDRHKVEQVGDVMGLSPPPSPRLWFDTASEKAAAALIPPGGPVLALGPAARWAGKTWPAENFSALALKLTAPEGPLPGARIAVFAAPGEESKARPVIDALPPDRRIDAIARTSPLEAGAAIARCALYIGNDSGLTHTAAATG